MGFLPELSVLELLLFWGGLFEGLFFTFDL